ncbi:phage tail spike protein [Sporosarcina psychrophila]|uniref:phage tail spike protein n=1 Tax=Sporosarcina psychrophila TaxID=1476 RepID=UPI00078E2F27|nr:phage tail spike protein [Sporosarcina psychrophila]AMQ06725.1 hypothetical protein AZE41_12720 [Sporosarcina psychrophila]
MSELLLFDPHDSLLAALSNEAEGACPYWDAPFKEVVNNGSTFEFTSPASHEDSKYIVAENQVAFMDKDGTFRLFVIKEPEKINGDNGTLIRAICESSMLELRDEVIEDVRAYNTTLSTALTRALVGTRWKSGQTADFGINSTNYYYVNVVEAIQEIINTWGGELRDRIEIHDNKITGRYIDILPRRGADTGKLWEIDKDILSISHKVHSYPKTALYGRGSSLEILGDEGEHTGGYSRKINFADVVWKMSEGDPVDKPLGQEWVGDLGALAIYGRKNDDGSLRHRFGFHDNGEQKDPAQLLAETWEMLQRQKRPIENYTMDVFLLEEITGREHEKVRLGDTTFAVDRSFADPIEVEERVISYEYDVADPDNTGRVELGQHIDIYSGDSERLDRIEAKLNDKGGIWDLGGDSGPVTDEDIKNVTPGQVLNVAATGAFKTIILEWDFDRTIYIANYEVYASRVKGFTPDAPNLIYRGKTSGYNHDANTNEQWYFRVRAVNTHGVAGAFSTEVMAQTGRVVSDDILFGPEIAKELEELSKVADLLSKEALDKIRLPNIEYTDGKTAAEEQARILAAILAKQEAEHDATNKADAVKTAAALDAKAKADAARIAAETYAFVEAGKAKSDAIQAAAMEAQNKINTAKSSLEADIAQKVDATWVNGQLVTKANRADTYTKAETDNAVNSKVSTVSYTADKNGIVSRLDAADTSINQVANEIALRAKQVDLDAVKGRMSTAEASLVVQSGLITTKVSQAEFDNLEIGSRNLFKVNSGWENGQYTLVLGSPQTPIIAPTRIRFTPYIEAKANTNYTYTNFDKTYGIAIYEYDINLNLLKDSAWLDSSTFKTLSDTAFFRFVGRKADNSALTVSDIKNFSITFERGDAGRISTVETLTNQTAADILLKANRTDVYTKTDANSLLNNKADNSRVSTVEQRISTAEASLKVANDGIALKASKSDVYTRGETDTKVSTKADASTVNSLTTRISSAEASLTVQANQITTKVSQTDFNNLGIGGRNLFQVNSGWENGSYTTVLGSPQIPTSATTRIRFMPYIKAEASTDYTYTHFDNTYGIVIYEYDVNFNLLKDSAWISSRTFKTLSDTAFFRYLGRKADNSALTVSDIKNFSVKLERGNKVTDWTPAPEDIDGAISTVSGRISTAEGSIVTLAGQVALKATQSSVDSITGRLSTAEASLNVLPGQINAKVSKDGVIAAFNLSTESAKLQAAKIELVGDVSIVNGLTVIANLAVGNAQIANAAITSVKIGALAVGTAAIANGAITKLKVGNAAIGTAQIENLAVTNAQIGNLAVDGAKIANASITNAKIDSINANKIASGELRGFEIVSPSTSVGQVRIYNGMVISEWTESSVKLITRMHQNKKQSLLQFGNWETGAQAELTLAGTGLEIFSPTIMLSGHVTSNSLSVFNDLNVYGSKNASVPTSQGVVSISAYETAEYYFGDIGRGTVAEGECIIEIDPLFKETVNTDIDYEVFLAPYGIGLIYVDLDSMNADSFVVKGDNIPFVYEIKAKRRGFEDVRLEATLESEVESVAY